MSPGRRAVSKESVPEWFEELLEPRNEPVLFLSEGDIPFFVQAIGKVTEEELASTYIKNFDVSLENCFCGKYGNGSRQVRRLRQRSDQKVATQIRAMVNTLYKTVARKVKAINDSHSDGSVPEGDIKWKPTQLKKMRAAQAGSKPTKFDAWVELKFSTMEPGARLTAERWEIMKEANCEGFTSQELELFHYLLTNCERALAWDWSEIGEMIPEVVSSQVIRTIDYEPFQSKSISVLHALRDRIIELLKDRLRRGTIEELHSSYRNKWFFVSKKDGRLRLINDAQRYNAFTLKDAFMLPAVEQFSEEFGMCKILSLLDFFSGYDQVKLYAESRDITTFVTPLGLFRMYTLPQGATNSVAQFMRVMSRLLYDLVPYVCQAFLDDIAVKGPTTTYGDEELPDLPGVRRYVADHIRNLDKVLLNAELAGATIFAFKSEWCKKCVDIVGFVCGIDGRRLQQRKIDKIRGWTACYNLKDVRSFLGMVVYYNHWIENFAHLARLLYDLQKKGAVFVWEEKEQAAMRAFIDQISQEPIIITIDYSAAGGEIILMVDASLLGWGAVLMQVIDGKRKPARFDSGIWIAAEQGYNATKRECRGLLCAFRRLRFHLFGCRFTLETDARVLVDQINGGMSDVPGALISRWLAVIKMFDFKIKHVAGSKNPVADALLRPPDTTAPERDPKGDLDDWCDAQINTLGTDQKERHLNPKLE